MLQNPLSMFSLVSVVLVTTVAAQPAKHPAAEKALARIVLNQDYGEDLKFHSQEAVTMARNRGVPGLNGLMFMRWKGRAAGTEVTASVQWFEKTEDLVAFHVESRKPDVARTRVQGVDVWKLGATGYAWSDGRHLLVSIGGSPAPPPEMLKAWLKMIPSRIAKIEQAASKRAPTPDSRTLGHGYSRRGDHIYFGRKRIDKSGAEDIDRFAVAVGHKLKLCSNVDADSFRALSEEYTKDRRKVYYKWISGAAFWVVELADADPATFEAVSFELARDRNHVWVRDEIVPDADPKQVKSFFHYRIWADGHHVWSGTRKIEGADPATFERIGTSEFGYYRDAKRVYSYFGRLKVVEGQTPAHSRCRQRINRQVGRKTGRCGATEQ